MNNSIPLFLYGTAWKENDTQRCVEDALAAGFRGIDTANQRKHYFEAGVGEALKKVFSQGQIKRTDVFLQTKFTSVGGQDQRLPYHANDPVGVQVESSFASSLEHLHTDYIDSYVLHGPSRSRGLAPTDWEVWRAMEMLHRNQSVKFLGVSNVSLEQLSTLWEDAKIKPRFVQNRCFARTGWDQGVRDFCRQKEMIYQGFSLLTANPEVFKNPQFAQIVARKKCTPAQAIFRFAMQVGMLPLTGTTDPMHMAEDFACTKLELNSEELETIEQISL